MNKPLLLILLAFISGCSPFGNSSLVELTNDLISDIFDTKMTQQFNSGGSQSIVSNPTSGLSQDTHSVTISAGNTFQQFSHVTPQGHTVEVIITGVNR